MKSSLRVLFLASWYPNHYNEHLGNFVQRHAEAIATKHEVFVVYAVRSNQPEIKRIQRGNLTEFIIYYRNELPFISYLWCMFKGVRLARKTAGSFDICHANVAWPAGLIALLLRMPYVVTEHFSGYLPARNHKWPFMAKPLTRLILNRAKRVVPVSQFLRNAIETFAPRARYTVIPNVVNQNFFSYQPPPPESSFALIHVSTLENESKNIVGLVKALRKIHKRNKANYRIQIGGDGDTRKLLKLMVRYNVPMINLDVFRAQPPHKIAEMMADSHALLMFSHYETQSCTVLEALCSGRPVISSGVGGIPEITNEQNSVLVEDNDVDALVEAIEEVALNYERFDGKKISEEALSKYSYQAVCQRYTELYLNVLNGDS